MGAICSAEPPNPKPKPATTLPTTKLAAAEPPTAAKKPHYGFWAVVFLTVVSTMATFVALAMGKFGSASPANLASGPFQASTTDFQFYSQTAVSKPAPRGARRAPAATRRALRRLTRSRSAPRFSRVPVRLQLAHDARGQPRRHQLVRRRHARVAGLVLPRRLERGLQLRRLPGRDVQRGRERRRDALQQLRERRGRLRQVP